MLVATTGFVMPLLQEQQLVNLPKGMFVNKHQFYQIDSRACSLFINQPVILIFEAVSIGCNSPPPIQIK
jgi:hypothetical protein